mmetsp:Transcript_15636/g.45120  ORF Transcript_15636/g.45120 Transcript_15636/m.45120 type:complete len:214 (+) Transcript_15636:197-838(+)
MGRPQPPRIVRIPLHRSGRRRRVRRDSVPPSSPGLSIGVEERQGGIVREEHGSEPGRRTGDTGRGQVEEFAVRSRRVESILPGDEQGEGIDPGRDDRGGQVGPGELLSERRRRIVLGPTGDGNLLRAVPAVGPLGSERRRRRRQGEAGGTGSVPHRARRYRAGLPRVGVGRISGEQVRDVRVLPRSLLGTFGGRVRYRGDHRTVLPLLVSYRN